MVLLILLACDERETELASGILITKVDYSGCFSTQNPSLKTTSGLINDSLSIEGDQYVLYLKADMVYNCCGALKDSSVIKDNIVNIYIYDSCLQDCLCKCLCLFKFKFSVTGYYGKTTSFKIYLKGYNVKDYSLWKELIYIDK